LFYGKGRTRVEGALKILRYAQNDKYEASGFLAFARNDGYTQDFHPAQLDKLRSE